MTGYITVTIRVEWDGLTHVTEREVPIGTYDIASDVAKKIDNAAALVARNAKGAVAA